MKKIQIGVIGSMTDVKIIDSVKSLAEEIGKEIAKSGLVLVFGFEHDFNSLPMIAAKTSEKFGGETIAFIQGSQKIKINKLKSKTIITGLERGGGREFPLVISCDGIICLGGGSGTLTEMAIAYQAGIPLVCLENSGGWSQKLANKFLDERKRIKIIGCRDPKRAIEKLLQLILNRSNL